MQQRLQALLHDRRGSALLWVLFLILIFFMLAAVLYNVFSVSVNYSSVRDELTRCTSVSLDANVVNSKLRDTITDVDSQPVLDVLWQNLLESGWTQDGNAWVKRSGEKIVCRLSGVSVSVTGSRLHLTATARIPLPMAMAERFAVDFPIDLYARILYIE